MTSDLYLTRRGRPREFVESKALSAALDLFWAKGYDGASVQDLAEAMGIAKPAIYRYFGNKEILFRKAMDLYAEQTMAYASDALKQPTTRRVAQRFLQGALVAQTTHRQKGCLGVIGLMALSDEGQPIRAAMVAREQAVRDDLIRRFDIAKADGDLPLESDTRAMAVYLLAIVQGMAVQAISNAEQSVLEGLVDLAMEAFPREQA